MDHAREDKRADYYRTTDAEAAQKRREVREDGRDGGRDAPRYVVKGWPERPVMVAQPAPPDEDCEACQ